MKLRTRVKSLFKIFKKYDSDDLSLRAIEEKTSIPKSSVHRHKVNYQKRIHSVGHDFFETDFGCDFLNRLILAVVFVFGIQTGVGSETIFLFFNLLPIGDYAGTSVSSLRKMKQKMRGLIEVYGEAQMVTILKCCKDRELHLGGDETWCGNSLFLVLMELSSGFIFTEESVENRTEKTWWNNIKEKCKPFKNIVSFTVDGGAALLKMANKLKCKRTMDLFHLLKDVTSVFAAKFHSKHRSLLSQTKKLNKKFSEEKNSGVLKQELAVISNKRATLNEGQQAYKTALFTISTASHPFKNTLEKQSSKELNAELHQQLKLLRNTAEKCEIADKKKLLDRFERRIDDVSMLNDLWQKWVEQSIFCKTNNSEIQAWGTDILLPFYYFKEQLRKSRKNKQLKNYYQDLVAKSKVLLDNHPVTKEYLNDDWISWAQSMSLKYQRTTSAIEGRNARLTQHYFVSRGTIHSQLSSLTAIHNFWIKRSDNTTAAERLCQVKAPDLFEYLLKNMPEIPFPRKSKDTLPAAA